MSEDNAMKSPAKYIVGLGASAGGLEALEAFFAATPPDSGLGFVVVQHLSPDYESLMDALLARKTKMPVRRVEDGMLVEANTIYLIPPKKNMILFQNRLLLTDQERGHSINLPIDIFLRSLAEDQEDNAIGIILSGTGSDGMSGVRAIKESGGMVMVQDKDTAKFDGMPESAISTGLVDYILPPGEMATQLLQYIEHPEAAATSATEVGDLTQDERSLTKIFGLLQHDSGVDFSSYKMNTVSRRIERRMRINQLWQLSDYVELLEHSPRELGQLYKELFIGVTNFFRDPEAWQVLEERVIPKLIENSDETNGLRIWCAGCSTGEEAYSLAILLREAMRRQNIRRDVKIFATDLDKEAMEFAMIGAYPESIAADVSEQRLAHFFTRKGEMYHVNRQLREMVIFARHNLIKDPPFTRVDLISCRNLLIYLKSAMQRRVLSYFDFSLRADGYLFLGSSETVGDMLGHFDAVDTKAKIYRSLGGKRLPTELPPISMTREPRANSVRKTADGNTLFFNERRTEPLYQAVITDFVPPGLVVDEKFNIIHIFKDISEFIKYPVGRLSNNILNNINPALRTSLSTALHKAQKSNGPVNYRNLEYNDGETSYHLDLQVTPYDERSSQERFYMIYFQNHQSQPVSATSTAEVIDAKAHRKELVQDLERELQFTKENLQATIEELETSNEELQATNEELVSSNEELQSTNEELQSVNEELHTVNSEYQTKIQELIALNSDIDNLMRSLDVATIFLDGQMRIRKFSPTADRVFNIRSQDVNRPLNDLTHRLKNAGELVEDIQRAVQTHTVLRREVELNSGEWMLMMIAPYTGDGKELRQDSVLSFVDITALKSAQAEISQGKAQLQAAFDLSRSILIECDAAGTMLRLSPNVDTLLQAKSSTLTGKNIGYLFEGALRDDGSAFSAAATLFNKDGVLQSSLKGECITLSEAFDKLQVCFEASSLTNADDDVEAVMVMLHPM